VTSAGEPAAAPLSAAPLFTVAGGNPSATDLAVLTVVLSTVAGGTGPEPAKPTPSRYNDPARLMRTGSWPSDLSAGRYANWAG
jgi:Acyl-CoA carboxylase epsilon subunit